VRGRNLTRRATISRGSRRRPPEERASTCAHRAQRVSLHATEADRPEIPQEPERFLHRTVIQRAARLIFIDDTGINLSMTRTHARTDSPVAAAHLVST